MLMDLYRGRADAENRIEELKYDFGFDSFNTGGLFGTEAALGFAMMAYNLMSIFRQAVLEEKTRERLFALRYRLFAIGGYVVKEGNSRALKLSLAMKRKEGHGSWAYGINQVTSHPP